MRTFTSYNPVTGAANGVYPTTSAAEVACAVEQARSAAEAWRVEPLAARCQALRRLREMLATHADGIAARVASEIGKPLQDAYAADLLPSLNALRWLERAAPRRLREQPVPGDGPAVMQPEPYGVVGVIGTWNYPLYLNLAPIAWALAAGNAVVWKPSELAPESALALAERFEQANLPVWTVLGDASTGRALCRAGCDKIAFTGSAATGRSILTELAATGTPSVMELSGNDAMIVCADAEAAIAARAAVWGRVANAGQTCASPQRIYVLPEVATAFLQEAEAVLGRLRPGVDYGPLRTEGFRQRVQAIVAGSVAQGACLLLGGSPLTDRPGFFYAPTLLADCRAGMPVAEQDFFGPVLAVFPVPNEAEAVLQANASALGLAASVWTRDPARGRQLATQLRVGLVSINEVVLDSGNPALPFGGARGSGFGKQRGALGLEEFVQWKVVAPHPAGGARRHLFPYRPETLPILRGAIQLQAARGPIAKLQALQQLVAAAQQWRKRPRNDFPPDG